MEKNSLEKMVLNAPKRFRHAAFLGYVVTQTIYLASAITLFREMGGDIDTHPYLSIACLVGIGFGMDPVRRLYCRGVNILANRLYNKSN